MQVINGWVFILLTASAAAIAGAPDLPANQPPIWSTKPDVTAF